MPRTRVFLSHAKPDKGRIKQLALALLKEEFTLFIDRPTELNFDDRLLEDHDITYIDPGATWDDGGIKQALRSVDVLLGCFSKHFLQGREVWQQEVAIADVMEFLVPCRIDDVDPASLPQYGMISPADLQSLPIALSKQDPMDDVDPATIAAVRKQDSFKVTVKALRKVAMRRSQNARGGGSQITTTGPNKSELMDILPLAGRCDSDGPYQMLRRIIDRVQAQPDIVPVLVCGPKKEEIDSFVNGINNFLIEKKYRNEALGHLGKDLGVTRLRVIRDTQDQKLRADLLQDIAEKINCDLPPEERRSFGDDALPFILENLGRIGDPSGPLLSVSSAFQIDDLNNDTQMFATVDAWVSTWREIAAGSSGVRVVAILPIHLIGAEPGWQKDKDFPPVQRSWPFRMFSGACINASFYQRFFDAQPSDVDTIAMHRVGVIQPVKKDGAIDWASDFAGSTSGLKTSIEKTFGNQGHDGDGVNMIDLVEVVKDYQGQPG